MKHMVVVISAIVVIGIIIGSSIWSGKKTNSTKLQVVGSFYPVAHFAEQVGGDNVQVTTITPAGAEPHDFEPSAQDIVKINQAQLFIYNGNGLDSWGDKAKADVLANGGMVIKMSEALPSLPSSEDASQADPHFWLDPVLAAKEVDSISQALSHIDPAHAAYYQQNAARYHDQLAQLDQTFRTGLADCSLHDFITSHAAFGYLAKEYNLNQIAIAGLSPDEEPSPQKLAEVAKLAEEKQIHYIFFEQLVSPKLSETIAQEVGAQTLPLRPIEGLTETEISDGKSYISEMTNNLTNLKQALECQ